MVGAVFEEIERNGFARTLSLIAKAAEHADSLKEPKSRSWENSTLGKIGETIAAEHDLKLAISDGLKGLQIPFIAQTEESDQNFLTRLGRKIGAVIAPKDGHLLINDRKSGKTATGKALPTIHVTADQLIADNAYFVRIKPRLRFSKVITKWQDQSAGLTKSVIFKAAEKGPSMTLREIFQSEAEARKAAEAKVNSLRSGEGELSLEMIGAPKAHAEAPIIVEGVSPDADGNWVASTVTHVWDYGEDGGARTTIEAEFGNEEKSGKKGSKKTKTKGKSSSRKTGPYVSILDR